MSLIEHESGTIQRFQGGLDIWTGRTQREVHPSRRDEAISYRWDIDPNKQQPRRDKDGWEHYSYNFIYRYQGRTLRLAWRCGTGYGTPKPFDGLDSAFRDAATVAYEGFGEGWAADLGMPWETPGDRREAQRIYDACERMEHRVADFFADDEERTRWEKILHDIDNSEATVTIHGKRAA